MRGHIRPIIYAGDNESSQDDETGTVVLTNDDDEYYSILFENWDEVELFIAELRTVAGKVFGSQKRRTG